MPGPRNSDVVGCTAAYSKTLNNVKPFSYKYIIVEDVSKCQEESSDNVVRKTLLMFTYSKYIHVHSRILT